MARSSMTQGLRLSALARITDERTAAARAARQTDARKRNAFAGAMTSRLSADWIFAGTRSAAQDTLWDLRTLRDRSRDLVRNSPFMARYHQLVAENVIGAHGIALQAKNLLSEGVLNRRANTQIEEAWREWCRPENCDTSRRSSLTELLSLAVSAGWAMDGEILIRLQEGTQANGWGFSIQLLDPDLLNEKLNQAAAPGMNAIYQGVEVDQFGAPVAYWLWNRHPSEPAYNRECIRVPEAQIIHHFIPLRPGQPRGTPWAASVMQALKMLDGYQEAELVAARIASATMAAIEMPDPEKVPGFQYDSGTTTTQMEVEPGSMLKLNPGEKLSLWDPQHPTQAFGDFVRVMLHSIAAGLGVSYGTLTGDLSQANYGSMRVGMLAERDHWSRLQQTLVVHVLDRIYRRWLDMAMLNQRLPGLGYDASRWQRVKWQPRGFDWIDPLKDSQGDIAEIAAGAGTITEMAAKRGRDLEEVLAERQQELKLFEHYGVPSDLAPKKSAPALPADDDTKPPASDDAPERSAIVPLRQRSA